LAIAAGILCAVVANFVANFFSWNFD